MFKLKLEGNKALLRKLEKISQEAVEMVSDEVEASSYNIHSKATQALQSNTTDNGDIQKSGSVEFDKANIIGQVEFRAKHAPYIEFGTGGFVKIPQGLEKYAMEFYVNGKGTIKPQAFLFPAAFEEYPKMIERINKGLKKETK